MRARKPGTVTWLHLSDVHLCKPKTGWDARRVLETLKRDLEKVRDEHGLIPDLIFFTGDLAFGHVPTERLRLQSQYQDVAAFLDGVRKIYKPAVRRERIFLVPGNHDVDRAQVILELTDWLDKLKNPDLVDLLIQKGELRWQEYVRRLQPYKQFLTTYGYKHLLGDAKRLIYGKHVRVGDVTIGIAGLNSAWSCGREEEKGKLWMGGRWQIETLLERVEDCHVTIAMMHHPHTWLNQYEDENVGEDLQLFEFYLHGHIHRIGVNPGHEGHYRISAGACYERSDRDNGYNLVRLDLKRGKGEVWLREYKKDGWRANEIPGKTDKLGMWPLELIRSTEKYGGAAEPEPPVDQGAAVCYRRRRNRLEVLLVETSGGRRMFPKKTLHWEEPPANAATRAAAEEAGVTGSISPRSLGRFHHRKPTGSNLVVEAYLLERTGLRRKYERWRNRQWYSWEKAAMELLRGRTFEEGWALLTILHEARTRAC